MCLFPHSEFFKIRRMKKSRIYNLHAQAYHCKVLGNQRRSDEVIWKYLFEIFTPFSMSGIMVNIAGSQNPVFLFACLHSSLHPFNKRTRKNGWPSRTSIWAYHQYFRSRTFGWRSCHHNGYTVSCSPLSHNWTQVRRFDIGSGQVSCCRYFLRRRIHTD